MSTKYFSRLFVFTQRYRLLKFPNPVLKTQLRILSYSEPTVGVETKLEEFSNEKQRIPRAYPVLGVHTYLRKNPEKYDVVKIEDIDLKEETNFKSLVLLEEFVDSARKMSPGDEPEMNIIPEELGNCIESECSSYTLNDLFKYIVLTSKLRNKDNVRTLVRYLSDELNNRKLSKREHLKILCLSKILSEKIFSSGDFIYAKKKILKFTRKIQSLTLEQVVVLFWLMRRLSQEDLRDFKFNLETYLLENLPKFNFDELIIVSRGLLKIEMLSIRRSITVGIAKKLLEEIENPHELPLFWIFKLIGSKASLMNYDDIAEFQEKILPYAEKFEGDNLVSLARTGAEIAYVNLSLWEILANNFKKNFNNYALDDIEKMVHMTVICNIRDEELLEMSIEAFQNTQISLSRHHTYQTLIYFVYDLIHHQIYPEKLLSLVLSKDFRLKYNPESYIFKCKQKYCFINSFIQFHRPDSNFEFLEREKQQKLYKYIQIFPEYFLSQLNCFKTQKKLLSSLMNFYGENFVLFTKFQPHFEKGIVMRFDKNLEAQPIPEEFKLSKENYKRAVNDEHIWIFIKVLNFCEYMQDTDIPNFETQTEIREMEAFGYVPVLISRNLFVRRKITQDLEDYVREVIKTKLQEVINKQRATI